MTEDPLLSIRKKGVPCTDAERRPYVTIREKSGIIFKFKNKMKVDLRWNAAAQDEQTARDLDLCLFYRGEDGGTGGVFSSDYRERLDDLGRLDAFPYILHMGDNTLPQKGGDAIEQICIGELSGIEKACICVVDYEAANTESASFFEEAGAYVEFYTKVGDFHRSNLRSEGEGCVYWVANLQKGPDGLIRLLRKRKVLTIAEASEQIPGFKLISNVRERADDER
jgi:hypothetical protein